VIRQAPSCEPRILPVGDCALTVEFGRAIDPQTHAMVLDFVRALESIAGTGHLTGVVEWAAAFCPATVCFDPGQIVSESLAEILLTLATQSRLQDQVFWYEPTLPDRGQNHARNKQEFGSEAQSPKLWCLWLDGTCSLLRLHAWFFTRLPLLGRVASHAGNARSGNAPTPPFRPVRLRSPDVCAPSISGKAAVGRTCVDALRCDCSKCDCFEASNERRPALLSTRKPCTKAT
jgi:hypothetical protein